MWKSILGDLRRLASSIHPGKGTQRRGEERNAEKQRRNERKDAKAQGRKEEEGRGKWEVGSGKWEVGSGKGEGGGWGLAVVSYGQYSTLVIDVAITSIRQSLV